LSREAALAASETACKPPPFILQNRTATDIRCGRFRLVAGRAFWFAAIAQLVEHVIRNDGVTGSSPVCGTNKSLKRRGDFCAICANQIINEEWNQRVTTRRCFAGTGPP
jgi:hypothetical protein